MPTTKADSLLDHALEAHKHRFGTVIAGDDYLGVTRKNGELFFAAVTTALQLRKSAIDGTLHCLKHFLSKSATCLNQKISYKTQVSGLKTEFDRKIMHCRSRIRKFRGKMSKKLGREKENWVKKKHRLERERRERERESRWEWLVFPSLFLSLLMLLWIPTTSNSPMGFRHVTF